MANPQQPRRFMFDKAQQDQIVSPTVPPVHRIVFGLCTGLTAFIHTSALLACGKVKIVPNGSRRKDDPEDEPPRIEIPLRAGYVEQLREDFGPPAELLIAAAMQPGVEWLFIRDLYEFRIDFADTYTCEEVMPPLAAALYTAWLKIFGVEPEITREYEEKPATKCDLLRDVKKLQARENHFVSCDTDGDVFIVDSLTGLDPDEV